MSRWRKYRLKMYKRKQRKWTSIKKMNWSKWSSREMSMVEQGVQQDERKKRENTAHRAHILWLTARYSVSSKISIFLPIDVLKEWENNLKCSLILIKMRSAEGKHSLTLAHIHIHIHIHTLRQVFVTVSILDTKWFILASKAMSGAQSKWEEDESEIGGWE